MNFKQGGSQIGLIVRYKNLFIFETKSKKAMLEQERGHPIYLLSPNSQTRLWDRQLGHASNVRVAQASELVDGINLGEISGPINQSYFSNSEPDSNSDKDVNISALIHKVTK